MTDPLDGQDYCLWLASVFPQYVKTKTGHPIPLAAHHHRFWEWVWEIRQGTRPDPLVVLLARGGAKSTGAELATCRVGATGQRRYGLYCSGTQDRADDHVQTIGNMLESDRVGIIYPELAERNVGKHGNPKGWRRNRLWTSAGFVVDAIGLDTASRGVKLDEARPDWIVFDDVDQRHDTPATTRKKIEAITEGIIPAGSSDVAFLFVQNLIHRDSVAAQLGDGRAQFLKRRTVIGPIPALNDFKVDEHGEIHGTPTWQGQNLEVCRAQVDDMGLHAFRREAQHEVAEAEGALWSRLQCEAIRVPEPRRAEIIRDSFKAITVAVDPSGGDGPGNDEVGIVAVGRSYDDRGYVLDDWSGRLSPDAWGRRAVELALKWHTRRVVAEKNYGGAMVQSTLAVAMQNLVTEGQRSAGLLDVSVISASVGKRQRAEPVAALCGQPDDEASWARSILYLLGDYPELEAELTGWVPDETKESPNRLDALVWSVSDLFPDLMGQEWTPAPMVPAGESRESPLAVLR